MPFGRLGVLFDIIGAHFGTSGAPWGAILAPRDYPGGPWEQQDGFEVVDNRIFVDFGVISGPVYVSFWGSKCVKIVLFLGLFPGNFLLISDLNFRRLGLPNRCFRIEVLQNTTFHRNRLQRVSGSFFYIFFDALGAVFLIF